jgi:hypothetical protein
MANNMLPILAAAAAAILFMGKKSDAPAVPTLSDEDRQKVLEHLNTIAPDTVDEGAFGPWEFTNLSVDSSGWRLAFTNSEGTDSALFQHSGPAIDAAGDVDSGWMDAANAAIISWEGVVGEPDETGEGNGGNQGEAVWVEERHGPVALEAVMDAASGEGQSFTPEDWKKYGINLAHAMFPAFPEMEVAASSAIKADPNMAAIWTGISTAIMEGVGIELPALAATRPGGNGGGRTRTRRTKR